MSTVEQLARIGGALWLVIAHAITARRLATALTGRQPLLAAIAAMLAVALTAAALDFHLLMLCGAFTATGALTLATLQAAIAIRATPRHRGLGHDLGRVAAAVGRIRRLIARSPYRGRIYFFAITSTLMAARTLALIPNSHDSVVYHTVKAALWLQEGRLGAMDGAGSWELYGLFPGGGELFTALAMLPLHSDVLAPAVDQLMWVGMGIALLALLRELGVREPAASIAAAFVLGVPTVRLLVGSCYVEPTMCFAFFLGLYFAVRFVRTASGPMAMLALATLGVAASTKFVVMGAAGTASAIVVAVAILSRRHRGAGTAGAMVGGSIAMLLIAPWLLHSFATTGYPFSPLPMQVFGITLGEGRILDHLMRGAPPISGFEWAHEWPTLKATFRLPTAPYFEPVGFFAAAPLLLAPFGLATLARRRGAAAALLTIVLAAAVYAYLAPNMAQVRHGFIYSYSRFMLPLLGMATVASVAFGNRKRWTTAAGQALWFGFVVNTLTYGLAYLSGFDCVGASVAAAGALGWFLLCKLTRRVGQNAIASTIAHAVGAAASLFALQQWKEDYRHPILRESIVLHPFERAWLPAAERLDVSPHEPRTVAITSGTDSMSTWGAYHLFGRRLQNRVVYVSPMPGGGVPKFWPSDGWEKTASYDAWLGRLRQEGVSDLVAFSRPCLELDWAKGHPDDFEFVAADSGVTHYRLRESR